MRNRLQLALTSWPFVCALAMLLLNDWWLKPAYPGPVTGKLSDFAGIAICALLLLAVWPNHVRGVFLVLSVFFLWWKSSLSQPVIDFINALAPLRIGRTVDYTDLVALAIVPVCRHVVLHDRRYALPWPDVRRVLLLPLIGATVFGTAATSFVPTRQDYLVRTTDSAEGLRREQIAEAIASVAQKRGLVCRECSSRSERAVYEGNGVMLTYRFPSPGAVSFAIEAYPNGLFFGKSGEDKADALRAALKAVLAERFRGLEYVEPLSSGDAYR